MNAETSLSDPDLFRSDSCSTLTFSQRILSSSVFCLNLSRKYLILDITFPAPCKEITSLISQLSIESKLILALPSIMCLQLFVTKLSISVEKLSLLPRLALSFFGFLTIIASDESDSSELEERSSLNAETSSFDPDLFRSDSDSTLTFSRRGLSLSVFLLVHISSSNGREVSNGLLKMRVSLETAASLALLSLLDRSHSLRSALETNSGSSLLSIFL